jgi:hypothetical protein
MIKKVLIFTDSRGQHKLTFKNKKIFTEKITEYLQQKDIEVDLMLCPFCWTSTIDFIQLFEEKIINEKDYDLIILYTGVVEYSPRPLTNYYDSINGNNLNDEINFDKLIKGKKKIYNNKLDFMKKIISHELLNDKIYDTEYMGEKTKSLISLEINEKIIIPYLKTLGNKLIFINSNKCVKGWEGNYILKNKNGRPSNINIIEEYSKQTISKFENYIDLLKWDDNDIKKYTVDNMHLTFEGSEYIYNKLIDILNKLII